MAKCACGKEAAHVVGVVEPRSARQFAAWCEAQDSLNLVGKAFPPWFGRKTARELLATVASYINAIGRERDALAETVATYKEMVEVQDRHIQSLRDWLREAQAKEAEKA